MENGSFFWFTEHGLDPLLQLVDVVQTCIVFVTKILLFSVLVQIFDQVFGMARSGGQTPVSESLKRNWVVILWWIFDDCVVDMLSSVCQVGILCSVAISSGGNLGGFRSLRAMAVVSVGSVGIGELKLKSLDGA